MGKVMPAVEGGLVNSLSPREEGLAEAGVVGVWVFEDLRVSVFVGQHGIAGHETGALHRLGKIVDIGGTGKIDQGGYAQSEQFWSVL